MPQYLKRQVTAVLCGLNTAPGPATPVCCNTVSESARKEIYLHKLVPTIPTRHCFPQCQYMFLQRDCQDLLCKTTSCSFGSGRCQS